MVFLEGCGWSGRIRLDFLFKGSLGRSWESFVEGFSDNLG